MALQVACLGYNKLVDLPVELCHLNCLEVLEVVNNSIDTMPLYLLRGAESMDFAMVPLVAAEHTRTEGACSADALLDQEQELLNQASQWCVHVGLWGRGTRRGAMCMSASLKIGGGQGLRRVWLLEKLNVERDRERAASRAASTHTLKLSLTCLCVDTCIQV